MMPPLTVLDGEFVRSQGAFCPFDVIFVSGVDARSLPLYSRKTRLVEALKSDTEHTSEYSALLSRQNSTRYRKPSTTR